MPLHPIQRGQLGRRELVPELHGLLGAAGPVDEADEPHPRLLIATVGRRPKSNLDGALPHALALEEAIDADLVELVDPVGGNRFEGGPD
jgi:hypothetical protein